MMMEVSKIIVLLSRSLPSLYRILYLITIIQQKQKKSFYSLFFIAMENLHHWHWQWPELCCSAISLVIIHNHPPSSIIIFFVWARNDWDGWMLVEWTSWQTGYIYRILYRYSLPLSLCLILFSIPHLRATTLKCSLRCQKFY